MIVVNKRSGRLRISRNVDSKYEDVARSLRRLQIQPVGKNIASVELNNGVIGVAGADMVHVPLVKGAIVEIDSRCAKDVKSPGGVRLSNENDPGIKWELIPSVEAVAVLLDLSRVYDIAEYSKHFPIRIERDGTIRSVDKEGRSKGEISLGVYHVKNADGVIDYLAEQGVSLERIAGGFMVAPRTLPYTTTPRPESIQKEPFKLWKGLGPNTNRKEH